MVDQYAAMAWTLLLTLLTVTLHHVICADVPVTTTKGIVVGINVLANPATTNIAFDAFLGIPYGDKPERFQLAKARTGWSGQITAQTDGAFCPQPNAAFSEDCLNLNVYTPSGASAAVAEAKTKSTTPTTYPVIVFLPGEGFIYSSASSKVFGPDFLIGSGVVLVTVNYRVGAAGFLSLGSKVAPGNLGLHDTLLALQWVQDEIAVFGGDPTKVTLFGSGSGSVITQFHYLSSLSKGLFQRAISQSGSALASWGHITTDEARRRALQFAKNLKCDTSQNDTVILTCLQKADIKDILANQSMTLSDNLLISGRNLPFVPVLDTNTTADKPFFSDSLENLMKAAVAREKPLLAGFTSDEGVLMFSTDSYLKAEANLAAFLPNDPSNGDKLNSIKNQYFNLSLPTLNKIQSLVSLYTGYLYANPAVQVSRAFVNFTYGYVFAYDGTWKPKNLGSSNKFYQYKMRAVAHGEDLRYLFYSQDDAQLLDSCAANAANINMKTNMVQWWTSFVKTGVPDTTWPVIFKGGYFVIDSQTSFKNQTMFEDQYYKFWASMQTKSSSVSSAAVTSLTLFLSLVAVVKSLYF